MLRFLTRTIIVPSSSTAKWILSPGLGFAAARTSLGIVVCPLLVMVAVAIPYSILTISNIVSVGAALVQCTVLANATGGDLVRSWSCGPNSAFFRMQGIDF